MLPVGYLHCCFTATLCALPIAHCPNGWGLFSFASPLVFLKRQFNLVPPLESRQREGEKGKGPIGRISLKDILGRKQTPEIPMGTLRSWDLRLLT